MAMRLVKTEAGQLEIRARAHNLARFPRTLLVLVDGTRTDEQLLKMVQGASPADLESLLAAGLIVARGGGAPAPEAGPGAVPAQAPTADEPGAVEPESSTALGYSELYSCLVELSREHLGMLKGYKFALDIERANGVDELREVARRLIAAVEKTKGEGAAQMVRRALAMPR